MKVVSAVGCGVYACRHCRQPPGRGGGRRCHLKFTRQTPSWMSMLRESLLNSLFTSSIPPTSLTVRVTLLFFFFSPLSCRFHVCPPSFCLLFCFLTRDCTPACLSISSKRRVSTSSVKDEREVCEHACATLCMLNRLICPKRASSLQGRALSFSSTRLFANAAVTPDLLPAKMGARFSFDILFYLNPL